MAKQKNSILYFDMLQISREGMLFLYIEKYIHDKNASLKYNSRIDIAVTSCIWYGIIIDFAVYHARE